MNIIDKLKSLGVEITVEIEKAFSGEWVSDQEVKKKSEKITTLETEKKELETKQENLEKELQALKDAAPDADALNQKIAELTETLETERKERADKDEKARLDGLVTEFFTDKHFVNTITADAIKSKLVDLLNSDEARGKRISDLFPLSRMQTANISRIFSLMIRLSRHSRTVARLSETTSTSRMELGSRWLN